MMFTLIGYGIAYLCYYFMLLRLAQSIRGWCPGIDTFNLSMTLVGITLSVVVVKIILIEYHSNGS